MLKTLSRILLGKSQDPMAPESRSNIALIAFLAWVGLGADGLSSSCYGPELGFNALAHYHHLALYLALLTCITIFIIAMSYNQVIELFPNGGGGYKVANKLLGPTAGVISGSALLIDYMLTIVISVVACIHALFSILPPDYRGHMLLIEIVCVVLLTYLNLRGMKESIKILIPIFLGFVITHLCIIVYGIAYHGGDLPNMIHQTIIETHQASHNIGLIAVAAVLLKAYSLGSGTYTGLEAVSNNVNMLAEPRVKTGKWTMYYMAASLSVIAGGIIVLYLLWHVQPVAHMTLNAVVFQDILGRGYWGHISLIVLLFFEAGLLLVGANTGFLGGPAVLANMAHDDWVPRRFAGLSSRLVKQNGVFFFGLFAILTLLLSDGRIDFLVVFYSINVFITFAVSLLGLSVYWWRNRQEKPQWLKRFCLSLIACFICCFILSIVVISKFTSGSWIALISTGILITLCIYLKRYYQQHDALKRKLDHSLELPLSDKTSQAQNQAIDPEKPTAVFLVKGIGAALHTILWVEKMFPKHFKNYIFVSYGWVDTGSFGSESALNRLQSHTNKATDYLTHFANQYGVNCESYTSFGTDPVDDVKDIAIKVNDKYNNAVYFASRYVYKNTKILSRLLHSDFSLMVQRKLQNLGIKMLIVPLTLDIDK